MTNPRPVRPALITVTLLALGIAGCPLKNTDTKDPSAATLKRFTSQDELLGYFKQQARQQTRSRRNFGFGLLGVPFAAAPPTTADATADFAAEAGDATGAGGGGFTTTNIQEAGVDESDVFKFDGRYFYIARNDSLRIVDTQAGAAPIEVGRLDLDDAIDEIYLRNDRVLLLARRFDQQVFGGDVPFLDVMIYPPYYVGSALVVYDIDVSNRAQPALRERVEFDGNLTTSRLTNDRLILILSIAPELPVDPTPAKIDRMTLAEIMPQVRANADASDMVVWSDWLFPSDPDGFFMTAVVTLDADDITNEIASSAVMASAGTVYASRDAVYITDAEYDPQDNFRERTAIHKFSFDDNGAAQYVASGSVPGRLLNQFSLGEHAGALRVATHVTDALRFAPRGDFIFTDALGTATAQVADELPPQPYNAVYVLQESGPELPIIGQVDNIAPGERIFSARFLAERGFLVTFRQVDPLFVLDLSDAANPRITGELKIPGFSDYLHPLGNDLLIGVGRSARSTGFGGVVPNAVQLSLFDISDMTNPTLIQQLELGGPGSRSDVSNTHKAFAILPDEGLLAIPVVLQPTGFSVASELSAFAGVVCYRIDAATGFTQVGSLPSVTPFPGFTAWQRPSMGNGKLYAITPDGVRSGSLTDLSQSVALALSE